MEAKFLVLEKGTYKIIDSAKSYCKRIRKHASKGEHSVYFMEVILTVNSLRVAVNEANNTNF